MLNRRTRISAWDACVVATYALVFHYRLRDASPEAQQALNAIIAADITAAASLTSAAWFAGAEPGCATAIFMFADRGACERFQVGDALARARAHPQVVEFSVHTYELPDASPSTPVHGRTRLGYRSA